MYLSKTALANDQKIITNKAYLDHVPIPATHSYTRTSDSNANDNNAGKEGGVIPFTIKRTWNSNSTAEASTIFVNTATGTADNEDFTPVETTAVNFGKKEKQKTIKVQTKTDDLGSEGTESFYLAIFKTADEAEKQDISANWQYSEAL